MYEKNILWEVAIYKQVRYLDVFYYKAIAYVCKYVCIKSVNKVVNTHYVCLMPFVLFSFKNILFVFLTFLTFKFWFHYLFLHFGTLLNIWET